VSPYGKGGIMRMLSMVVVLGFLFVPVTAQARSSSLIEKIASDLAKDTAFTTEEREQYLSEFREQMAGYALDAMKGERREGADVIMTIVMEGSFDNVAVERTVAVASAAYIAIRRGSDPDIVEGIALYGFRKKVPADRIEAWANGYRECIRFGVAEYIAEDLISNAAEHGWDVYTYNKLKWGLVEAVKAGYDMEDFEAYMVGNFLKGNAMAGTMVSNSLRYFRKIKAQKKKPELPAYTRSFIPRKKDEKDAPAEQTAQYPKGKEQKQERTDDKRSEQGHEKEKKPEEKGFFSRVFNKIDNLIQAFLGAPYVWGGETPKGTDCSGFVRSVYQEIGIELPRVSRDQWKVGHPVDFGDLKKGDLVFFRTIGSRISHVGIVSSADERKFAHASSSRGVVISELDNRYYKARYAGAKRVLHEGVADQMNMDEIVHVVNQVGRISVKNERDQVSSVMKILHDYFNH